MGENITEKTSVRMSLKQVVTISIAIITAALYINGKYSELDYRVKNMEENYTEYQLKQVPMMIYNMESMSQDLKLIKDYIIPTTTINAPNTTSTTTNTTTNNPTQP